MSNWRLDARAVRLQGLTLNLSSSPEKCPVGQKNWVLVLYWSPARGAHPVRGKGRAHPQIVTTKRRTFFQPDSCGLQACVKGDSYVPDPQDAFRFRHVRTLSNTGNLRRIWSRLAGPAIRHGHSWAGPFAGSKGWPHSRTGPRRSAKSGRTIECERRWPRRAVCEKAVSAGDGSAGRRRSLSSLARMAS